MPSIIDKRIISEYLKVALKHSNKDLFSKFGLINDESYKKHYWLEFRHSCIKLLISVP